MKKKLGITAVFIAILCLAAIVFAEDTKKYAAPNNAPKRPSVKPQRPGGAPMRPTGRNNDTSRARGLEAMIERETKRTEEEVTRVNKVHAEEVSLFKAIIKQANDEKAPKTAALIKELMDKKNEAHKKKVEKIKGRIEDIKKRMQRSPRQPGQRPGQPGQRFQPGQRPQRGPARGQAPMRDTRPTRNTTPPSTR